MIERIAADPQNSFDHWRKADKPFAFVAACMELSRAKKDPQGFTTHLPIPFDCTCNGIQHLAVLSRDDEAGRLVNLDDTDTPQDIYLIVTRDVMKLLENEDPRLLNKKKNNAWCFQWWRKRLAELDERQKRKLFKTPTMTFPYASTVSGMADKIIETYLDLFGITASGEAATFLARAVRLACQDRLKGPVRIMKYVRELALYRFNQGKFLEWRSPTGFPCANMYQEPNVIDIDLGSVRSRYSVADGALPEMKRGKMLNAASPNFIHSLDAAHLMRTVLTANRERIRDVLTVHDSMACLAPHAQQFGQIIRREFAMLYAYPAVDPLAALRAANVDDPNLLPLPERGDLDPLGVQRAEYFSM
jgi:DNA-directed RNA polymerase